MDKCALTCPGCSSRALIACHRHWRTDKSTGLHPKSKTLRATSDQLCPTRPSHRPKVNSTLRASPFAPIPISSTIRSGGISPSTPQTLDLTWPVHHTYYWYSVLTRFISHLHLFRPLKHASKARGSGLNNRWTPARQQESGHVHHSRSIGKSCRQEV